MTRSFLPSSRLLAAGVGVCALSMVTASANAALFSDDFEGQTVGERPTGTAVRPNTNSPGAGGVAAIVVDAANNPAGTGNGLRLFDDQNLGASSDSNAFENNFVADAASQVSSVAISFDVARNADLTNGTNNDDYERFAVGAFDSSSGARLNSSSRTFLELRFEADGEFRVDGSGGNTSRDDGELAVGVSNNVDVIVNDDDVAVLNYLAPDGSAAVLAPNQFAVYLNDTFVTVDGLENGALTGSSNLGRAGFVSFNDDTGLDYTIDNFVVDSVTPVPEPGSIALLGLGAAVLLRRRKA